MSFIFPPVFLRLPSVKPSCSFHFEIKMSRCLLFVVINFPLFKCFQQEITVVVLPWIPHPWRDDPCLELSLVIPEQSALLSEVVMIQKLCCILFCRCLYMNILSFHKSLLSTYWVPGTLLYVGWGSWMRLLPSVVGGQVWTGDEKVRWL